MKYFIVAWLVWQLMLIGIVRVDSHNQIVDKKYDCSKGDNEKFNPWNGAVVPLVVFVPEVKEITRYCDAKSVQ